MAETKQQLERQEFLSSLFRKEQSGLLQKRLSVSGICDLRKLFPCFLSEWIVLSTIDLNRGFQNHYVQQKQNNGYFALNDLFSSE